MPSIYTVFNRSTEFDLANGDASEKAIDDLIVKTMDDYPVRLEADGDKFSLAFDGGDVGSSFQERVTKLVELMGPHVNEPFHVQLRIESMSDDERDTNVFGGPDEGSIKAFRDKFYLDEALEMLRSTGNPAYELLKAATAGELVAPDSIQVIAVMDGGLIQNVLGTHEVDFRVVDYDTEGADEGGIVEIPQNDGKTQEAYCFGHEVEIDPKWCAEVTTAMDVDNSPAESQKA